MSELSVNVIILNWNGWQDTITCVKSVQASEFNHSSRIVVIDNCSTNESVSQIKKELPEIELIENENNLGFGGGCNVGILNAINEGVDFVWLLNNDTTVAQDGLQELFNLMCSDPEIGIVGSAIYNMGKPKELQAFGGGFINFWTGSVKPILSKKDKQNLEYITGASMLIRTAALREVGVFDQDSYFMYWEDADLCFRLVRQGWKLEVAENSIVYHKESASLENTNHLLVRYFNQSAVRFFCKFYRFCVIPVYVGLLGRLIKRLINKDRDAYKELWSVLIHDSKKSILRIFR